MPSERDIMRCALYDAIGWQEGLMDAYSHMKDDPAYAEAVAERKRYRWLLKKYFRETGTPEDRLRESLGPENTVTLSELMKRTATRPAD